VTLAARAAPEGGAAAPANPLDLLGDADAARWTAALKAALADPGVDGLLAIYGPNGLSDPLAAADAIIAAEKTQTLPASMRKPVMAALLGAATIREAAARLERDGAAVFASPGQAVAAFGHLAGYARAQAILSRTPPGMAEDCEPDRNAVRAVIDAALGEGRDRLTEPEAGAVLASYGAPMAPGALAPNPAHVRDLAADLLVRGAEGVVVKLIAPELDSKSDVGGVRLNIATAVEARDAAAAMMAQAAARAPAATVRGLLVQPMLRMPEGYELLLALRTDAVFGPVMIFGRGGLSVEVVADKAAALPPLDLGLARDLIAATRTGRLMAGGRGLAAADIDAVAATLIGMARLAADFPQIAKIEINPLLAGPDGAVALDARIVLTSAAHCAPGANPRFAIRPYPTDWDRTDTVKGRAVRMRPIRPEDERLYPDFLDAVDPADMRLRFFSAIARPTHAQLAKLVQIDYARAMAFVAIDAADGALLGVSRLAADPDGREAEYAVLVRSALHGAGVGAALMRRLIAYARAEGFEALHGDVMTGNAPMLGLCAALGFDETDHPDDPGLRFVRLPLNGPG
jgi:acetyltransferase